MTDGSRRGSDGGTSAPPSGGDGADRVPDGESAGAGAGAGGGGPALGSRSVDAALALDALVVAAVALAGVAVRALPLYWSPLPATLDGFVYVGQVERVLATGGFPTPAGWDALGWAGLLGVASAVSGVAPLYLAQPLTAAFGGATCLAGAAVARRVARDRGWSAGRARTAAALAGLALALDGLYARRTGVPDEEVLGLVLVPVLALAVHRSLAERGRSRLAWGALAAPLVVALPPTHGLTALVAALSVTAVVALHLPRGLRTGALAVGAAGATWGAVGAYYAYASVTPALELTYVDRLLAAPGLFLAWVVLLAVGAVWYVRTGAPRQRALLGGGFALLFALLALNLVGPVFPGTTTTPRVVLALALALAVPAALAAWAPPRVLDRRPGAGWVALAAVAGPLAMVGYSLSAGLTFDYYSTAIRTQTFLHVGVCVLAALAVAGVGVGRGNGRAAGGEHGPGRRARALRVALALVLVAATLASVPLAVVTLDSAAVPATTTEAESAATAYAAGLNGSWASGRTYVRLGNYHGGGGTVGPLIEWARGGPPPACPAVATRAWTTTGFHRFPAPPETVPAARYERWLATSDRVFSARGVDRVVVVRPAGEGAGEGSGCAPDPGVPAGP